MRLRLTRWGHAGYRYVAVDVVSPRLRAYDSVLMNWPALILRLARATGPGERYNAVLWPIRLSDEF